MSDGVIFLVQPDESLVRMHETPYSSEDLLQRLLAQYPDILAGEQIDTHAPRRWMLISREIGVPMEDGGSDRWSLDHLFLDQDAVPTLVEVKRSSDTRIRREVVGQMFDYAANAVLHWPITTVIDRFHERCENDGANPADALRNLIGDGDPEAFWKSVETNLKAGRVRLVFVADKIPDELRTIVEFLANQMNPAETFAIEVKQYVGSLPGAEASQLRNLVPRVVAGRKPEPPDENRSRGHWTVDSVYAALEAEHPELAMIARRLVDFGARLTGKAPDTGSGTVRGSLTARMKLGNVPIALFSVYTTGELSINLGWNSRLTEFGAGLSEQYRTQCAQAGFAVDEYEWGPGWNKFPLAMTEERVIAFEHLMSSIVDDLRARAAARTGA